MEILSKSASETQKFASTLSRKLGNYNVILLFGDLGSGKTTFVSGFGKGLGFKKRILSPSFVLAREYKIPKSEKILYHVDLYRLESPKEIEALGLKDWWQGKNNILIIEWAEKLAGILPKRRIEIRFKVVDESTRRIQITRV